MEFRLVRHEDIDKTKWNSCVHYANRGNVFGYKWYIDTVAKKWDALVEGEYETVFPLIEQSSLLQSAKIYQPSLLKGLGIYSIHILSANRIKNCLAKIPDHYQVDLLLNEGTKPPDNIGFDRTENRNYQLFLNTPYDDLAQKYSPEIQQALDKALNQRLVLSSNLKPEQVADFYRQYSTDKKEREQNFHAYQRIMYNALHRGWGFASGVENEQGQLVGAAFFISSHGRLLRLLSHVSPEGEQLGANALLFDMLIRTNARRPLILDFNTQGTDLRFDQFGAQTVKIYGIQRQRKKWGLF